MTEHRENLERIDKALEDLGRSDAPERLVQETLKNVRDIQITEHVPNRYRDQRWAGGIAAAVVAVSALGIVFQEFGSYQDIMSLRLAENAEVSQSGRIQDTAGEGLSEADKERRLRGARSSERGAGTGFGGALDPELVNDEQFGDESDLLMRGQADDFEAEEERELKRFGNAVVVGGRLQTAPAAEPARPLVWDYRRYPSKQEIAKLNDGDPRRKQRPQSAAEPNAPDVPDRKAGLATSALSTPTSEIIAAKSKSRDGNEIVDNFKKAEQRQSAAKASNKDDIPAPTAPASRATVEDLLFNFESGPVNGSKSTAELDSDGIAVGNLNARLTPDGRIAERFLAQYRLLDDLDYQQPTGYWANSYVPGDPAMHRLEAQLRSQYPQALATTLERNAQPFDAPGTAALGVYLHATQTAVDGPSRVQVQVGLQTAERQGGLRLPMNVAVVLDLPETVNVAIAQQARALLIALNEQRQTGDHFSITVAGVPGGLVVQPDDYRHGTVVSFIEHLVDDQLPGDALDLVDAFVTAVDRLAANDDPNAVLGSSLVLLVTADGIDSQTRESLEILAHQSAVAGMSVSVITLAGVNGSDLDAIVLAGQGRLRALGSPADAAPLIDRELHSASRTVARAIRLRIQLTPGVRLVDVIGSVRLDELDAERVREAERIIDTRLSRNWGIEADRGEDEDGIQIVIPGMAAGESYVVLLDVVVDGPGTVADVRVRYKDLIQMSNGVARASLSLGDANATRHVQGPLERNVLKNLLAYETAEAARRGGRLLANGETAAARAELTNALTLISGLRESVVGWENDAELQADEQRLAQFVSELDAGRINMLVASLEYAAYRKLLPATINED